MIPRGYLDAPTPSVEEFRRGFALRAVEGRGALTESGIAEHCRFKGGAKRRARRTSTRSSREGLVRRVEVDDGGPPVVVPAGAELDGAPSGAVLLCPFDNLMWDRPFLRRAVRLRPPDRGLQARARAGVRLLRAAAARRRPPRRPRRPEGGPRARRAADQALHARAGRAPPPRRAARARRRRGWRARSGSSPSSARTSAARCTLDDLRDEVVDASRPRRRTPRPRRSGTLRTSSSASRPRRRAQLGVSSR